MSLALTAALAYVVLIPGSGSSGDRVWLHHLNWAMPILGGDRYFGKLQDDLAVLGIDAIVCPSDADEDMRTIEERAEQCVKDILARETGGCGAQARRHVHLLGHSMGGLVARSLAQDPRVERCIGSVTLVSTPNRGTPIADWAIEHAAQDDTKFDFFGKIVKFIDFVPSALHYLPQLRVDRAGYAESLFRAQDLPDNAAVAYFSVTNSASKFSPPPISITRDILAEEIRRRDLDQTPYGAANDGIVPEYSMVHGRNLGHIESDHFGSGCGDPGARSAGCRHAEAVLLKHLLERTQP